MSSGTCDVAEVERFCQKWLSSSARAQELFQHSYERYMSGDITYDESCEFSEHNYRYKTHPQTNLSELNTVNLIACIYPEADIRLATRRCEQKQGADVYFTTDCEYSVSTKLMIVGGDNMRCFTLSTKTIESLKKDNSDLVAFIDNIAGVGILVLSHDVRTIIETKSLKRNKLGRVMMFYDYFNKTRDQLVRYL